MIKPLNNILINSTLAFISAFLITTFIHEFGHFLSYLLFDANPILFHNYVQAQDQALHLHIQIISALAGPVISLIQALVFAGIVSKHKSNTVVHLFFLWLGLLGFVNFFGYLVMTPFTTTGDTGKVAELLNLGFSIRLGIAFIGFVILIWIISKVAKNFANFIPAQNDGELRRRYVYRLMFFPIIIGSLVNALLAFPVITMLSIVYPATSSYVIMSSFSAILGSSNHHTTKPDFEDRVMKSMVILFLCAFMLNRFLTRGIG